MSKLSVTQIEHGTFHRSMTGVMGKRENTRLWGTIQPNSGCAGRRGIPTPTHRLSFSPWVSPTDSLRNPGGVFPGSKPPSPLFVCRFDCSFLMAEVVPEKFNNGQPNMGILGIFLGVKFFSSASRGHWEKDFHPFHHSSRPPGGRVCLDFSSQIWTTSPPPCR